MGSIALHDRRISSPGLVALTIHASEPNETQNLPRRGKTTTSTTPLPPTGGSPACGDLSRDAGQGRGSGPLAGVWRGDVEQHLEGERVLEGGEGQGVFRRGKSG